MRRYPFWLVAAWVMAVGLAHAAEQGEPPSKLALLVGVGKYQSDTFTELKGCLNDVEDVRQLLTTQFGFTEKGIKTLLNEQATHKAIVETFQKHLIERAGRQSTVVFYFSGHGSQLSDEPGGDEVDGFDETLCPYDTRADGTYDLTDDEFAGLLAALRAEAPNVTVIIDACHSGNGARGLARARTAPPDNRPAPPKPFYAIDSRGMVQSGLWDASQYTFLSGCQSDQESIELDFDTVPRGIFTYSLVNALRRPSGSSLRDALEEARAGVQALNKSQTPTSEGNLDRIPFGETLPPPKPFFEVVGQDGDYTLKGGKVHGVTAGSEFDLYAPGTKEFIVQNRLGQARVRNVAPFTAALDLLGSLPASPRVFRAVESKHVFVDPSHGVYVKIADPVLQSAVKEVVKTVPGAVLTEDGSACRLVITDAASGPPSADSIRILDTTKTVEFARMTPAAAGSSGHLADVLKRLGAWLRSVELHNPTTAFQGEFKITKVISEDSSSRGLLVPEMVFKVNDRALLYVKNGSAKDLYLYVLNYSSDGSVSQVYPAVGSVELINSGMEWSRKVRVTLPADRESMIEVVKVVVTGRPVDFSGIFTDPVKPDKPALDELPRAVLSNHWAVTQRVYKVVR